MLIVSNLGHDLINRLLTYDPEKRATANEAQQHEYFRKDPRPKAPLLEGSTTSATPAGKLQQNRPEGDLLGSRFGEIEPRNAPMKRARPKTE